MEAATAKKDMQFDCASQRTAIRVEHAANQHTTMHSDPMNALAHQTG